MHGETMKDKRRLMLC